MARKIILLSLICLNAINNVYSQAAHTAKFLTTRNNISIGGTGNVANGQTSQPNSQSIGASVDFSSNNFMISARIQPNSANNFFNADSFSVYRLNLLNKSPNFYAYLGCIFNNSENSNANLSTVFTGNLLLSYSSVNITRTAQNTNTNNPLGFSMLQYGLNLQFGIFANTNKRNIDLGMTGILLGLTYAKSNFQNEVYSNRALEDLIGLQNNPTLNLNKKYGSLTFRTSLYVGDGNLQPFFEITRNFTKNNSLITLPNYINRNFFNFGISAAVSILLKMINDE